MKASSLIRKQIQELPKGTPFTASMFFKAGSRAAIDQTLSRLARAGKIQRITRGVFARPKESRFVGKVPPSSHQIVRAMAKASGGTVHISGAEAARKLGLSTQVPTTPVYYTSGRGRRFHIGNLEVTLKHVSPRKLALGERPAGEALSALWHMGKTRVTPEVIGHIKSKLPVAEYAALKNAAAFMPEWMADALRHYERQHA